MKSLVLAAGILCFGIVLHSQAQPANGLPPLIDRELFFGDPEISGAQISPDGKFIAFMKPFKGTKNIWVKRTEEPFDKAKPITADTARPFPLISGVATANTSCSCRTRLVTKTFSFTR
jgi:hypothetical protein